MSFCYFRELFIWCLHLACIHLSHKLMEADSTDAVWPRVYWPEIHPMSYNRIKGHASKCRSITGKWQKPLTAPHIHTRFKVLYQKPVYLSHKRWHKVWQENIGKVYAVKWRKCIGHFCNDYNKEEKKFAYTHLVSPWTVQMFTKQCKPVCQIFIFYSLTVSFQLGICLVLTKRQTNQRV